MILLKMQFFYFFFKSILIKHVIGNYSLCSCTWQLCLAVVIKQCQGRSASSAIRSGFKAKKGPGEQVLHPLLIHSMDCVVMEKGCKSQRLPVR